MAIYHYKTPSAYATGLPQKRLLAQAICHPELVSGSFFLKSLAHKIINL